MMGAGERHATACLTRKKEKGRTHVWVRHVVPPSPKPAFAHMPRGNRQYLAEVFVLPAFPALPARVNLFPTERRDCLKLKA